MFVRVRKILEPIAKRTLPSLSEHHDAMVWTENLTLTWSMIVEVAFLTIEVKHRAQRIVQDYLNIHSLLVLAYDYFTIQGLGFITEKILKTFSDIGLPMGRKTGSTTCAT